MKLKKIVSLALAGVLAVSMLAGCSNTTTDNGNTQPEVPTTSSVVSTIDSAIKAHSKATVSVKESAMLNDRIDSLVEKYSYQELSADKRGTEWALVVNSIESVFGEDMKNLMDLGTKPANLTDEAWYYAVVDAGTVSGTTALVKSANEIAAQLSDLKDEYIVEESKEWTEKWQWQWPVQRPDKGTVQVDVSYTADYTMYVCQVNMTKTADTSVPVTIAVLHVNPAQKV